MTIPEPSMFGSSRSPAKALPTSDDSPDPSPGTHANEADAEDPFASDLALALMMQEQERAHFILSGGGIESLGLGGSVGSSAAGTSPEDGVLVSAGEALAEDDMSDEALAWRLMEEEERAFNQRLMAMASAQFSAQPRAAAQEEDFGQEHPLADAPEVEELSYEGLLALGDMAGHVSRGASDSALRKIRKATFGEPALCPGVRCGRAADNREEDEEQCTVCRMEYEKGEDISILPCGHYYHTDCISEWMKVNKACPICSKEVVDDQHV